MKRRIYAVCLLAGRYAAAFATLITAGSASAASLSVNPVQIFVPYGQNFTQLTLVNHGSEKTIQQVQVYKWEKDTQTPGELVQDRTVLVSPAMVEIKPHSSRVVRFKVPGYKEKSSNYRVSVREILPDNPKGGLRVRTEFNLPLITMPVEESSNLSSRFSAPKEKAEIVLSNQGNITEQGYDFTLFSQGKQVEKLNRNVYIFPGSTRTVSFNNPGDEIRFLSKKGKIVARK